MDKSELRETVSDVKTIVKETVSVCRDIIKYRLFYKETLQVAWSTLLYAVCEYTEEREQAHEAVAARFAIKCLPQLLKHKDHQNKEDQEFFKEMLEQARKADNKAFEKELERFFD